MKKLIIVVALLILSASSYAEVSFDPLPGQVFRHQETFDTASPSGWNLAPTFVAYPHAPTWKIPGASEVVDGVLTSSNKNGAGQFDVTSIFGPWGVDLTNDSVALYMRLWEAEAASRPRVMLGFMNYAAEEPAPDTALAKYVGGYVRNQPGNCMISWGGKHDMDNQADAQYPGYFVNLCSEGWYDFALLFEGNGTSISVSAFRKEITESTWTQLLSNAGLATVDTTLAFDSRMVYLWSRDDPGVWKIDEFAVSQVPEPATVALLGLGGLILLRRKRLI